jgi:hypothetical protein
MSAAVLAGCTTTSQGPSALPGRVTDAGPQRFHGDVSQVGLWVTSTSSDWLFGFNKGATKMLTMSDLSEAGCFGPRTVKVDHEQNIWVACESLTPQYGGGTNFGGEQEYIHGGSGYVQNYSFDAFDECLKIAHGEGLPPGARCTAKSFDGGTDNKGHVFAELSLGYRVNGGNETIYFSPGFYWWNAKKPYDRAKFIQVSKGYCLPFCYIYYMDTDNAGNIWFDFATQPMGYGPAAGLGEVTHPTTSPAVKIILPPGTYKNPGGVYVSGHGTVLNVTDTAVGKTYQYHLPVTESASPFNVLAPKKHRRHDGYNGGPVAGGFNQTETAFALVDSRGWIDIGKLPENTWLFRQKKNCCLPFGGAAYTPSDK